MNQQLLFEPTSGTAYKMTDGKWRARVTFSTKGAVEQTFDSYSEAWQYVLTYFQGIGA